MDNGDIALSNAINDEIDNDSLFLEKCQYHEKMMEKFLGDRSPMIMAQKIVTGKHYLFHH